MNLPKKVQSLNLIAFDIETTGRSNKWDSITEIGAYNIVTGEKFSTFANPGKKIPKGIVELTHITDDMVKDAPSQKEAIEAFMEFAGENPIFVGHNLAFDIRFIMAGMGRCGMKVPDFHYIDTLPISRKLYPDLEKHKLGYVCELLGIENKAAHRAYEDAEATAKIFIEMCNQNEKDLDWMLEPKVSEFKEERASKKQMDFIHKLMEELEIDEKPELYTKAAASKKIGDLLKLKAERRQQILSMR